MNIIIPVQLDRVNYVVWELEIIKALTGNSALAGLIRGIKTLESTEDEEVETNLVTKTMALQEAQSKYDRLSAFIESMHANYKVSWSDLKQYGNWKAKEMILTFGFKIYEQWNKIKLAGSASAYEESSPTGPESIGLKDIEDDTKELKELLEKLEKAKVEYEAAKHAKTQHFAVFSDSKKRLKAEAGQLCNLIMTFGATALVNPNYLRSLKSSSKWAELEGYQARADVKKLMDCLFEIQKSSNHSSSTHVVMHVWRLTPFHGENFYSYDCRMYEAVEYLRRDNRDSISEKHLIQLYRENLRMYSDSQEVARFVENHKVVDESPTFDEYRRRFLSRIAEATYYRETNAGNFSTATPVEEMIVCAAVGVGTTSVKTPQL